MAETTEKTTKTAVKKATPKNEGSSAFAVIETGGKQYRVAEGDLIKVEKMDAKAGDKIKFDKVLMTGSGENINLGFPILEKTVVEAEVVGEGRDKKVLVMKYKAKSRYFKKNGHRQPFQMVKVTKI